MPPNDVNDPELRARLNLAKLRAVVREHTGDDTWNGAAAGTVAAVTRGPDAFVLAPTTAGLGAALAFAARRGLDGTVTVVADDDADAAVMARRAVQFRVAPVVLRLEERTLHPVEPAPHLPPVLPDPAALEAAEPLRAQGAEIVVEHGEVIAELDGLEVGRVVPGPDGGWVLEVGVGKFDRAATAVMEAVSDVETVRRTVTDVVRANRRAGVTPHLLNRLARQRWLRSQVLAAPALVDATELVPVEPPLPRRNLIDPSPAIAAGRRRDGRPVVVACSVGVDLDLVPTAADARARHDPDAELVIVTPPRDQYPVLRSLAAALLVPATLVALHGEWPL